MCSEREQVPGSPRFWRLAMEFQPAFMAGYALRKNDKSHWERKVRPSVVPATNATCSICGFVAEERRLIHADEVWTFPEPPKAMLVNVRALCTRCHDAKDYAGLLRRIRDGASNQRLAKTVRDHYCMINGCSDAEFEMDFQAAGQAVNDLETLYGMNLKPEIDYGRWARRTPRPTRSPRPPASRPAARRLPPATTPRPLLTPAEKYKLHEAFDRAGGPILIGSICLKSHKAAVRYLQSLSSSAQKIALSVLLR